MTDTNETDRLARSRQRLHEFVRARDWEQFQTPKNLIMALTGELGELAEHFQWLSCEQSDSLDEDTRTAVREELADVQIYLLLLADRTGVDLLHAVEDKINKNQEKYPVNRARGNARKYTEL